MPIIGNQTLMDLALPGTHDTLTYDLSTTVADSANDLPSVVSWFLHEFSWALPIEWLGEFIRLEAQTQTLDVVQQLEAGVRFLDLRQIYTLPPDKLVGSKDWYGLHMVQTKTPMFDYLSQIKQFVETNPSEVIALFLSRHGSTTATGSDQYPGISVAQKHAWWSRIKDLFGDLLFDAGARRVNETSLATLVSLGQRVVVYVADHAEFTGGDTRAIDSSSHMINDGAKVDLADIAKSLPSADAVFTHTRAVRETLRRRDTFYLVSLAGSVETAIAEGNAECAVLHALHVSTAKAAQACSRKFHIPNMTSFCPNGLLEQERLRNFYQAIYLDKVITNRSSYAPPGAIYLDVLGPDGTVRTDTIESDAHGFAYVDTLLLWNVLTACDLSQQQPMCDKAQNELNARRSLNPLYRWDDPAHGRHASWPIPV